MTSARSLAREATFTTRAVYMYIYGSVHNKLQKLQSDHRGSPGLKQMNMAGLKRLRQAISPVDFDSSTRIRNDACVGAPPSQFRHCDCGKTSSLVSSCCGFFEIISESFSFQKLVDLQYVILRSSRVVQPFYSLK